jgi:hypothetical protein
LTAFSVAPGEQLSIHGVEFVVVRDDGHFANRVSHGGDDCSRMPDAARYAKHDAVIAAKCL